MGGIQASPEAEIEEAVRTAVDRGVNFFDLCGGGFRKAEILRYTGLRSGNESRGNGPANRASAPPRSGPACSEAEGIGISVMKPFHGGKLLDEKTCPFHTPQSARMKEIAAYFKG